MFLSVMADVTSFTDAVWQTFVMISIAELFDKTFFVALILALRYNKLLVFCGCFSALFAHTLLAAVAGAFINRVMDKPLIDFSTAALYGLFAVMYFWDWHQADPDGDVMDGMEEAREALGDEYGSVAKKDDKTRNRVRGWSWPLFICAFTTTFMAEMGDRTQIAMIGQHAVQPIIPVIVGSAIAFLQLTVIAVLTGAALQNHGLKERTVLLTGAVSFLFFCGITLLDGFRDIGVM